MALNFKDIKETVRIKGNKLSIKILSATGKEGDYYVTVSPALLVSGYGSTEEEAKQSFEENLRLFCEDFMKLNQLQKESELMKLGFAKVKFHNKDYSRAYVDENGVLQGFEPGTLRAAMLEETF
jgi:predicted RNase H-like HicB family nuclease